MADTLGSIFDPLTGVPFEPSPQAQGKFERISKALLGGLKNWIETPGRAMREGITTEDAVNWAAPTALGMIGAPGVPAGATLGSAFKYPLYHGSPQAGLRVLEPSVRGPLGPGVYTSPAEQIAGSYGRGGTVYTLPSRERDIFQGAGHRSDAEWFGFKDDKARLLAAADPAQRTELATILDKMWSADGYPLYQRVRGLYGGDEAAQNLFKRAKFEGVSGLVDGPETLLFGRQLLE